MLQSERLEWMERLSKLTPREQWLVGEKAELIQITSNPVELFIALEKAYREPTLLRSLLESTLNAINAPSGVPPAGVAPFAPARKPPKHTQLIRSLLGGTLSAQDDPADVHPTPAPFVPFVAVRKPFEESHKRGTPQHTQLRWNLTETANYHTLDLDIGAHALKLFPFSSEGTTLSLERCVLSKETVHGHTITLPFPDDKTKDCQVTLTSDDGVDFMRLIGVLEDLRKWMEKARSYQSPDW